MPFSQRRAPSQLAETALPPSKTERRYHRQTAESAPYILTLEIKHPSGYRLLNVFGGERNAFFTLPRPISTGPTAFAVSTALSWSSK